MKYIRCESKCNKLTVVCQWDIIISSNKFFGKVQLFANYKIPTCFFEGRAISIRLYERNCWLFQETDNKQRN